MFLSPQSAMDPAAGRFLSPSSAEQQPSGSGSRFLTPSAAEPGPRHGRRLSFMRRLSSRILMHDEEEGETTPTMASKQDCFRVKCQPNFYKQRMPFDENITSITHAGGNNNSYYSLVCNFYQALRPYCWLLIINMSDFYSNCEIENEIEY